MNWTPVVTIIFSLLASGIIAWLVYLTISVTEVDRTQEGVERINENQTKAIIENRTQILEMPNKVHDRYTGKEATRHNNAIIREIDHIHEDLKNHRHDHKEIDHEKGHK